MPHVCVDDQHKADAAEALASVGLTLSDAARILRTRVASEGGLPADPKAYDACFRAKVHEALNDASPVASHTSPMASAQAVIDEKLRARN